MDVINRGKAVCSVTNKQRRRQPVKKPPGVSLLAQLAPCTMTPPSLPLLTVHRHQSDTPNTCHLKKNNRYNSLVRSNFCLRYSFPLLAVGSRTRNPCGSRRRFFSLPSNFRTIHLRPSIRVLFFSYPLRSPRICTVIVIRSKPVSRCRLFEPEDCIRQEHITTLPIVRYVRSAAAAAAVSYLTHII